MIIILFEPTSRMGREALHHAVELPLHRRGAPLSLRSLGFGALTRDAEHHPKKNETAFLLYIFISKGLTNPCFRMA